MNKGLGQRIKDSFDKQLKISEGIGALKVINAIAKAFRQPDGSIHATYDEWTRFMTPYTELPK